MKKAKIVLSAVALFAVVGGAFAFKASRGVTTFYYKTSNVPGALCTISTELGYTTAGVLTTTIPYTTTNTTSVCTASVREFD